MVVAKRARCSQQAYRHSSAGASSSASALGSSRSNSLGRRRKRCIKAFNEPLIRYLEKKKEKIAKTGGFGGRGNRGGKDWRTSNIDKVMKSVRGAPRELTTEKDLLALHGVGPKTAQELLAVLREGHAGFDVAASSNSAGALAVSPIADYIPKKGSAPYAVLVLLGCCSDGCTQSWIESKAFSWFGQPQSRVRAALESFRHDKQLIEISDANVEVLTLTKQGRMAAERTKRKDDRCFDMVVGRIKGEALSSAACSGSLVRSSSVMSTALEETGTWDFPVVRAELQNNDGASSPAASNSNSAVLPSMRSVISPARAGCWELILLVDTRELPNRRNRSFLPLALRGRGVQVEVRPLPLGDMMWIVRRVQNSSSAGLTSPPPCPEREYVLDFIVERKTAEDLASSVKDGRFLEQKYRLDKSGLQRVIYLVENELNTQDILPADHLLNAVVYTEMADGYMVQRTAGPSGTVEFLARMHKTIKSRTVGCSQWQSTGPRRSEDRTFKYFNEKLRRSAATTIGDAFGAMLRQVHGMSSSRAEMVMHSHPTPADLLVAFDKCAPGEFAAMLNFSSVTGSRAGIGPALSKTLAALYCDRSY